MNANRMQAALFAAGDYAGGALIGGTTAAAIRGVVSPETDMVVAMLAGMALGTIVHVAVGFLLVPVLGMFHAMVPGSLIGMYGGMFFAMRDTMQHPGTTLGAIGVGSAFGVAVVLAIRIYDRVLRDTGAREG